MKTTFLSSSKTNWYLWLFLAALTIVNILLLQQNIQLRSQAEKRSPQQLQIGEKVQAFSGTGLDSQPIKIDYSESAKKRLFLYFTPSCKYCHQQFPDWKELLTRADSERFEVFGLVSDKLKRDEIEDYLRSFDCNSNSKTPLPVIFASKETLDAYRLVSTPTTLLISPEGDVEKVLVGKWNDEEKKIAFASLK